MDSLPQAALPADAEGPGDRRRGAEGKPEPYRRLDTAVLEAIVLKGALGMTEDDISHLNGLAYSKNFDDARDAVGAGRVDAGFFMRATPVEQVREVAEAGESMPPEVDLLLPQDPHRARLQPARVGPG